jgi:hypothetical protein
MTGTFREGDVLVRVSREILALLKTGGVKPVVMLGVHDLGDGTYEMVLQEPPRDLRAENARLRAALKEYGQHGSWRCEHRAHNFYLVGRDAKVDPDCPCGLDAELRALGLAPDDEGAKR